MPLRNLDISGMVTVLTGEETQIALGPGAWELIDLGIDSAGAAQASAKTFIGLRGPIRADFAPEDGKLHLRQSGSGYADTLEVTGPAVVRAIASGAETTLRCRRRN